MKNLWNCFISWFLILMSSTAAFAVKVDLGNIKAGFQSRECFATALSGVTLLCSEQGPLYTVNPQTGAVTEILGLPKLSSTGLSPMGGEDSFVVVDHFLKAAFFIHRQSGTDQFQFHRQISLPLWRHFWQIEDSDDFFLWDEKKYVISLIRISTGQTEASFQFPRWYQNVQLKGAAKDLENSNLIHLAFEVTDELYQTTTRLITFDLSQGKIIAQKETNIFLIDRNWAVNKDGFYFLQFERDARFRPTQVRRILKGFNGVAQQTTMDLRNLLQQHSISIEGEDLHAKSFWRFVDANQVEINAYQNDGSLFPPVVGLIHLDFSNQTARYQALPHSGVKMIMYQPFSYLLDKGQKNPGFDLYCSQTGQSQSFALGTPADRFSEQKYFVSNQGVLVVEGQRDSSNGPFTETHIYFFSNLTKPICQN